MESRYDGTCKGPDKHTWKAGEEVFYDKTTKAICSDGKCFKTLKEGGATEGNGKPPIVQARTNDQRLLDAKTQLENLWTICLNKATTIYHPEYTMEKASEYKADNPDDKRNIMILAQVFFKGLSMGWSRP